MTVPPVAYLVYTLLPASGQSRGKARSHLFLAPFRGSVSGHGMTEWWPETGELGHWSDTPSPETHPLRISAPPRGGSKGLDTQPACQAPKAHPEASGGVGTGVRDSYPGASWSSWSWGGPCRSCTEQGQQQGQMNVSWGAGGRGVRRAHFSPGEGRLCQT